MRRGIALPGAPGRSPGRMRNAGDSILRNTALGGRRLVALAGDRVYPHAEQEFDLEPFGYRWLRLV